MPLPRPRFAVLLLALACVASPLAADDTGQPRGPLRFAFATYGIEQGLESLSTMDLLEDKAGNIWVATQEGVVRFDGDRFQTFGRTQGLPSPVVFDLEQDGDGLLWAGTLRGLARLDGSHFVATELPGSAAGESVEALALDGKGRLVVGAVGGVYRCQYASCERIYVLPTDQTVSAIAYDPTHDQLWFAGPFGLVRWKDRELERYGAEQGLPSTATRALLVDRFGNLWVRQTNALLRLDTADGTIAVQPQLPPAADVGHLLQDRHGTLWVTSDRGLFYLEGGLPGAEWQRIGTEQGLPGAGVAALLEDHEGSLWIGTEYAGLARWLGRDRFVAWNERTGLPNDVVWAIERTSDGRLAFGTPDGLTLVAADGADLRVLDHTKGLPASYVLALMADDHGGLWTGLVEGGLAYVERDGRIIDVGSRQHFPDDLAIAAIELGPAGAVWLATSQGVWEGNGSPETIRFRRVAIPAAAGPAPPLRPEPFADLLRDRSGVLWAAGRYGLARLDGDKWTRLTHADGLLDDFILSLAQSADGAIWIGYRDAHGVSELRFRGGKPMFRNFSRGEGLRHDQVSFVRSDALGRIWIGTTRGISVRVGDRFANFGRYDGMLSEDTCANSFHADPDGTAWIGTPRGALAARLTSEDLAPRPAPQARILSLVLGGEPYDPARSPRVDYGHAAEIDFSARTFRATQELEFRYRLAGLGERSATTTQHSVRYAALAPDRYTFEIAARVAGGDWGPPAKVSFEILPPWWRTAPAGFAAVLLAAVTGLGLDRLRTRTERRRRSVLEAAVTARTRELDASRAELARKNDELGQLALTDPLTGLRNRRFAWEFFATEVARIDREWQSAAPGETVEAAIVFFLLDIDLFKSINDLHGHEVGDQILIEAAERIRHATQISDVAVRWGGEEFLVVARDVPEAERAPFAARLRQAIAEPPFQPRSEVGAITCTSSLGYAAYPFDRVGGLNWHEVLRAADQALYAVKHTGRDADLGVTRGRAWNGTVPNDLLAAQVAGVVDLSWGRRKR